MDATSLRWVLAVIGVVIILGLYLFSLFQNKIRRKAAVRTFTHDELKDVVIQDESLRDELSNIDVMLDKELNRNELNDIKINPGLEADNKLEAQKDEISLPSFLNTSSQQNFVIHVLKYSDNRLITSEELMDAFAQVGLESEGDQYRYLCTDSGANFFISSLAKDGSLEQLRDAQFTAKGLVCYFDKNIFEHSLVCYEIMLKKIDEIVRLLNLKVYNQKMDLLTLQDVNSTRKNLS